MKSPLGMPNRRATRSARSHYDRIAPIYDVLEAPAEKLRYRRWRALAWSFVDQPEVLELGIGTGKNLPHHPPRARVIGIDLSARMLRRAARWANRHDTRSRLLQMDAQALAFRDAQFNSVVATFVFCSVPDPVRGLQEARRVLRPGGELVLVEHVRSPRPFLGRLMDLLNPLVVRLTGVNINRDTLQNVKRAGFDLEEVRSLGSGGIFLLVRARA